MIDTSSGKVLTQTEVIASANFNVFSLFAEADFFVQLIMIGLIFASVWSWTLIFQKIRSIFSLQKTLSMLEQNLPLVQNIKQLKNLVDRSDAEITAHIFEHGIQEISEESPITEFEKKMSLDQLFYGLENGLRLELNTLRKGSSFLSTLGSTAPFIGLLGTVWGIVNSFQSIGTAQNTNLATVAPGIAEALLATALGLVAAIPALVAYNFINQFSQTLTEQLGSFIDKTCLLYSKEINK